tara:strand:- start:185 stop:475 length:291 start_codon:yes stop_codon:yes gene_type:complete
MDLELVFNKMDDIYIGVDSVVEQMKNLSVRWMSREWRALKGRLRTLCSMVGEFNDNPTRQNKLYREFSDFELYMRMINTNRAAQKVFPRLRVKYLS